MPRERKSFLWKVLSFRYLFVINLAVVLLLGFSFGREFLRNAEIQRDIEDLQAQAEALQTRQLEMSNLSASLQTESAIEREARLKLGLKKPGEQVVVIRPEASGSASAGLDGALAPADAVFGEAEAATSLANPVKWWYYFFDQEAFRTLTQLYGT